MKTQCCRFPCSYDNHVTTLKRRCRVEKTTSAATSWCYFCHSFVFILDIHEAYENTAHLAENIGTTYFKENSFLNNADLSSGPYWTPKWAETCKTMCAVRLASVSWSQGSEGSTGWISPLITTSGSKPAGLTSTKRSSTQLFKGSWG